MTMEHLSDQQKARVEALNAATPLIRRSEGAFKGVFPPEIGDLVDLSEYILRGVHPMDRYQDTITLRTASGEAVRSVEDHPLPPFGEEETDDTLDA